MEAGIATPDRLPEPAELSVATLGPCRYPSPLQTRRERFNDESVRVLIPSDTAELHPYLRNDRPFPTFELAGARRQVFFDAGDLTSGIVTCGGLCPGLNNVIRAIVLQLTYAYGVRRILGFRYGYAGLNEGLGHTPIALTPDGVESLHESGGTLLGSSRGPQDLGDMVDTLARRNVGILFVIGGDGGLRGAAALAGEILRRELPIGVVGVPKTIDNDLQWTWRSFGFATAVEAAGEVILAAHAEARGAWNGIGLVKLMGRHSGFIAAHATLARPDVNFCLVPEVPFSLDGENGFLRALEKRLDEKHHAVVAVAEGAGQELLRRGDAVEHDASGNVKLGDVGTFLRDRIVRYFGQRGREANVKYIDPSYTIRSLPANSMDSEFCLILGQHAVHAGMAGRTGMVVGMWNQHFVHIPIPLAVASRKRLDPRGEIWQRVLDATGQPARMTDPV